MPAKIDVLEVSFRCFFSKRALLRKFASCRRELDFKVSEARLWLSRRPQELRKGEFRALCDALGRS